LDWYCDECEEGLAEELLSAPFTELTEALALASLNTWAAFKTYKYFNTMI
jgi:hypothetical protein